MTKTGILYHQDYLLHDTGFSHPEKKERLDSIIRMIEKTGLMKKLVPVRVEPATMEILGLVHSREYIQFVKDMTGKGAKSLDSGDTIVCEASWHAALLAAGGVCSAVDAVMRKEVDRVFCAVRPPGHHASRDSAMGFCIFNNVAVAARYFQKNYGLKRVAIIDWDVHHGNGTQEIFYKDSSIYYLSIHQSPHYPGTGFADEMGEGAGEGFTYNIPIFPHTSEEEYIILFEDAINSEILRFRPEFILISAGFDAHANDPLANLLLTEKSFVRMTKIVCDVANETALGRVISVLEGGYDLDSLSLCAAAHVRQLLE